MQIFKDVKNFTNKMKYYTSKLVWIIICFYGKFDLNHQLKFKDKLVSDNHDSCIFLLSISEVLYSVHSTVQKEKK